MPTIEEHPIIQFGEYKGWDRQKTALYFGFDPESSSFRQVINGHTGASLNRAKEWAKRSKGFFDPIHVLEWHQDARDRHRRRRDAA